MVRLIFVILVALCSACSSGAGAADATVYIDSKNVVSTDYIGNGVQWDPYQLDYGFGRVDISESDWAKIYDRLENMSPNFIRLMLNTTNYIKDGELDLMHDYDQISRILNFCQSHGVTVMIGDWGGHMLYPDKKVINRPMLDHALTYADFLINDKGFSCIKYYNMVNEPNGYWSSNAGDYALWAEAARYFTLQMKISGLDKKMTFVGPDAAIWDQTESWWIDSCATKFSGAVGLYDIHTYPSKSEVNSGKYSEIIRAYKQRVPKGKQIVMGEVGLKFHAKDPVLDSINKARIAQVKHASRDDSQMFVFDHFYGTDMLDALIQTMNEGYSGSIIWMLDDAMHANYAEGAGMLKIWGFWNILGEEYFGGAEHEKVRPAYYAWSLASKYIPKGSNVYAVEVAGLDGVRAAVVEKDGKHTFVVVNISDSSRSVNLRSHGLPTINNVSEFRYAEGDIIKDGDCRQLPNRVGLKLDLEKGFVCDLTPASAVVYTNM